MEVLNHFLGVYGLFKKNSNVLPSQDSADNIIQNAKRKATEQHILYVLSQFKVGVADIDFVETTSMYFAKVALASNIRMTKLIYLKDLIAESIASNWRNRRMPTHLGAVKSASKHQLYSAWR